MDYWLVDAGRRKKLGKKGNKRKSGTQRAAGAAEGDLQRNEKEGNRISLIAKREIETAMHS